MNYMSFFIDHFKEYADTPALVWRGELIKYSHLVQNIENYIKVYSEMGVTSGKVVVLEADYSEQSIPSLFALFSLNAIVAPLLPLTLSKNQKLLDIIKPDFHFSFDENCEIQSSHQETPNANHELINFLKTKKVPGLLLFTSGSSGEPKAVVHDFSKLVDKFRVRRPAFRTLNFLLFDHWGGLNTLFHCLSNGSFLFLPENRNPDYICKSIGKYNLELLPASPSFLNILIASGAIKSNDLSSLKLVTYGAEPMPEATLKKMNELLPNIDFRQTYGLIELGVLRAKSKGKNSLWVKVGGDGYDVRVVDELLEIKADSAMLGYLNAPSPFTKDGYFMTGDKVLQEGEYIKILGRESELINIGGNKVFPQEVENIILDLDYVVDVLVYSENNPLTGKVVCAKIKLRGDVDPNESRKLIKKYCSEHLEIFKIPVKMKFLNESEMLHSDRMKRVRVEKK